MVISRNLLFILRYGSYVTGYNAIDMFIIW